MVEVCFPLVELHPRAGPDMAIVGWLMVGILPGFARRYGSSPELASRLGSSPVLVGSSGSLPEIDDKFGSSPGFAGRFLVLAGGSSCDG